MARRPTRTPSRRRSEVVGLEDLVKGYAGIDRSFVNLLQHDLTDRADVIRLVDTFYDAVRGDDILGPIFNDTAKVDWSAHLPKMYDFWETVLFGKAAYKGNPLAVHLELAQLTPLGAREFDHWVALFHGIVDTLFAGPSADEAKARASRIATVLQHHLADAAAGARR